MKTSIFHLIDGAKRAEGLTVIIDVFRAFSMECWLYDLGAKEIRPTGSFVNAKATAAYILEKAPEKVSLVCMIFICRSALISAAGC